MYKRQVLIRFPEPQTDFIFSVIGQNFGFLGTTSVVALLTAFDLKLISIASRHDQPRERYMVAGMIGMLLFQQLVNMGMITGLFPITGITLPFISYGGSSMLSYMICLLYTSFRIEISLFVQSYKVPDPVRFLLFIDFFYFFQLAVL